MKKSPNEKCTPSDEDKNSDHDPREADEDAEAKEAMHQEAKLQEEEQADNQARLAKLYQDQQAKLKAVQQNAVAATGDDMDFGEPEKKEPIVPKLQLGGAPKLSISTGDDGDGELTLGGENYITTPRGSIIEKPKYGVFYLVNDDLKQKIFYGMKK